MLPKNFVQQLRFMHPLDIFAMVTANTWPSGGAMLQLRNEVRPVDLYCYLGARFGPPNGPSNFFRNDDSDNLVHWDWTLAHDAGLVVFLGMNFRTEVRFHGEACRGYADRDEFVAQLKSDFAKHGKGMAKVRRSLEPWVEFVNPYQRIRHSVDQLVKELSALALRPSEERIDTILEGIDSDRWQEMWTNTAARYSKGFGLCFGVRAMLPVMAEAFVNLLIYVLMRPAIRRNERLREHAIRQPIDVRVKSLSINCIGFKRDPDYEDDACKRYQTLVNERNDLLHGNVVVEKLKFNEVYFHGKVPVFREYRSLWERSLGVAINAVGLERMVE